MARKGCGPYNLGAPKAIGKQLKDPKTGSTVRTEEQVEGGKMVTFTTTTPGTGGVDIEVKKKPTKTYKQFEAEGGNVEAAKAYNSAQRAKASIAPTSAQTDIKKRFIPDAISVKPESIKPSSPKISAEGIKPPKKAIDLNAPSGKYFYKKDVNKKFGSSSERGRSSSAVQGPNFGNEDYGNVTKSRPMTQREEMLLGTDIARKTGGATASPYGQGGEEGFQNYLSQVKSKLKERTAKLQARSSNKKVKSAAYKMKGYMSNLKK